MFQVQNEWNGNFWERKGSKIKKIMRHQLWILLHHLGLRNKKWIISFGVRQSCVQALALLYDMDLIALYPWTLASSLLLWRWQFYVYRVPGMMPRHCLSSCRWYESWVEDAPLRELRPKKRLVQPKLLEVFLLYFFIELCHLPSTALPWAIILFANVLQIALFFRLLGTGGNLTSACIEIILGWIVSPPNSCLPGISECDLIWK